MSETIIRKVVEHKDNRTKIRFYLVEPEIPFEEIKNAPAAVKSYLRRQKIYEKSVIYSYTEDKKDIFFGVLIKELKRVGTNNVICCNWESKILIKNNKYCIKKQYPCMGIFKLCGLTPIDEKDLNCYFNKEVIKKVLQGKIQSKTDLLYAWAEGCGLNRSVQKEYIKKIRFNPLLDNNLASIKTVTPKGKINEMIHWLLSFGTYNEKTDLIEKTIEKSVSNNKKLTPWMSIPELKEYTLALCKKDAVNLYENGIIKEKAIYGYCPKLKGGLQFLSNPIDIYAYADYFDCLNRPFYSESDYPVLYFYYSNGQNEACIVVEYRLQGEPETNIKSYRDDWECNNEIEELINKNKNEIIKTFNNSTVIEEVEKNEVFTEDLPF